MDKAADGVVDDQEFETARSTVVAGGAAGVTTGTFAEAGLFLFRWGVGEGFQFVWFGGVGFAAFAANLSDQALGEDADEGAADEVRFDTEVE